MVQIKIAFTGTHGTGKTTAALELTTELKKRKINAELISEAARSCPLPINKATTVKSQTWIFAEMIRREQECCSDVIICDRTLLDVIAYTERIAPDTAKSMRNFVRNYIRSYDVIFYIEPKEGYLTKDGTRSTDKKFQAEIKKLIDEELQNMDVETTKGNNKVFLKKSLEIINVNHKKRL
jgi:thymidylate kinase